MTTESILTMDILEFRQSRVDCTHDEHFDVLPNVNSVSPVVLLYSSPELHCLYGNWMAGLYSCVFSKFAARCNWLLLCHVLWQGFIRLLLLVNQTFLQIGDIIRYAGSFCALIYMFFLPCYLKMLSQKEDSLGQKWTDVPVWSLVLHPLLIVIGICNFISQVAVEAY